MGQLASGMCVLVKEIKYSNLLRFLNIIFKVFTQFLLLKVTEIKLFKQSYKAGHKGPTTQLYM